MLILLFLVQYQTLASSLEKRRLCNVGRRDTESDVYTDQLSIKMSSMETRE